MDPKLPNEVRRRYGRQIRLADIGEAGQAKLCSGDVHLKSEGFARTIEQRYVTASGMRVVDLQMHAESTHPAQSVELAPAQTVAALGLRHRASSEVAEGALHALVAMRDVLGVSTP